MTKQNVLVLGTGNRKKVAELGVLLKPHGFELRCLADFSEAIEVAETGATFAENARLKATGYAMQLGHWVLGEDSGLCVDALDGAPGVFSARFSGDGATDASNNEKLLKALEKTPARKRTAHYVASVALSDATGEIHATAEAECHGLIRFSPAGHAGFGYDPLFEMPEYHRTFAELGDAVKSMLSHRARAMRQIVPSILRLLQA